jgi:small subunit ribosomal protein S9
MEKLKKAIGRRKEAVARVYLSKGNGKITVNERDYKVYFPLMYLQNQVELPLKTIDSLDKYDVNVNVAGGGQKGQAEAIKLGLSRALCNMDIEIRQALKPAGLLTRDPRWS